MNQNESQAHVRIWVIGIILIFFGIGGYFFLVRSPSTPITTQPLQQTTEQAKYLNERFGYSFTIPTGYRIASRVMEFLNTTAGSRPIQNYTEANAENVVVTAHNQEEEEAYLEKVEAQINEGEPFPFFPSEYVLTKSIEIFPTAVSLQSLLELGAKTKSQNPGISLYTNVRKLSLTDGTIVTRFIDNSRTLLNDTGPVYEVVYIPISEIVRLRSGEQAEGFMIRMSENSFDNGAFDTVINSFQYHTQR